MPLPNISVLLLPLSSALPCIFSPDFPDCDLDSLLRCHLVLRRRLKLLQRASLTHCFEVTILQFAR